jgi:hypothetical protein
MQIHKRSPSSTVGIIVARRFSALFANQNFRKSKKETEFSRLDRRYEGTRKPYCTQSYLSFRRVLLLFLGAATN